MDVVALLSLINPVFLWTMFIGCGGLIVATLVGDFIGDLDVHFGLDIDSGAADGGWISSYSVFAAFAGFGATGTALSLASSLALIVMVICSVLGGLVAFWLAGLLFRFVRKQQFGEEFTREQFVGHIGNVTLAIPNGGSGLGEVELTKPDGSKVREAASSNDDGQTPSGAQVFVTNVEHGFIRVTMFYK